MDRRGIALLTAAVLLATFSTAPAAPQDPVGRIREASSVFVGPADPSVTTARVRTSLLALLDVTADAPSMRAGRSSPSGQRAWLT